MTTFTIRLKTEAVLTRAEAYSVYGEIAEGVTNFGLTLIEITDDVATVTPSAPSKPARKPRGPNKAKIELVELTGVIYPEQLRAQTITPNEMPTFLKRERE